MHLKRIHLSNLFSYDEAEINLQDYNVIVGPNNSGKTNLVRLMKLFQGKDQFNYLNLPQVIKFDKQTSTFISMHLKLSDEEARILLQYIFHKHIPKQQFPKHVKNIQLAILWTDTVSTEPRPQSIFCRFENGIILFHEDGDTSVSYCAKISDPVKYMLSFKVNSLKLIDPVSAERFLAVHKITPQHLFDEEDIFEKFLELETPLRNFFELDNKTGRLNHSLLIEYNNDQPHQFQKDGFDFLGLHPSSRQSSDFWQILDHVLKKNIIIMKEFDFDYDQLVLNLQELNKRGEKLYKRIQNEFSNLFEGNSFELRTMSREIQFSSPEVTTHIIITEPNGDEFLLEFSASGFFEAIAILYAILNTQDHVLVLDEPALHLHPNKISDLSQQLMKMPSDVRNQIIVITHSPYFLPYDVFFQDYLFNWNTIEQEHDRLRLRRFLINTFGNEWKTMHKLEKLSKTSAFVENKTGGKLFLEVSDSKLLIKNEKNYLIELSLHQNEKDILVFSRNLPSSLVSYVKKSKRRSDIIQNKSDFPPLLKPHLFKPEVFFSKFTILVEGPGDEMALKAISDFLWGLFQHHNIATINVNGKENIDSFITILKAYEIPYVSMVDDDYSGTEDVIKHNGKLEDVLELLGWDRKKDHIDPNESYEFISDLMRTKDGKKKIMDSSLGKPIKTALSYMDIEIDKV